MVLLRIYRSEQELGSVFRSRFCHCSGAFLSDYEQGLREKPSAT